MSIDRDDDAMTSTREPGPSTLWILIGPKGSGKTFIGGLLERERGVEFLRVEPIFLRVIEEAGEKNDAVFALGFHAVAEEIDRRLAGGGGLVIESTAAWHRFGEFVDRLRARHRVRMVRVRTPAEQCIQRVRTRDAAEHIPVSDDDVRRINEVADAVRLEVEGTLENADGTSAEALLAQWDQIVAEG